MKKGIIHYWGPGKLNFEKCDNIFVKLFGILILNKVAERLFYKKTFISSILYIVSICILKLHKMKLM